MKNEIFVILSHAPDKVRKDFLFNLVCSLKDRADILICSHVPIDNQILDLVDYFLYVKKNELLFDSKFKGYLSYETDKFFIKSKNFFSYNSTLAVYNLLFPGLVFAKQSDYQIAHLLEYDCQVSFLEEFNNNSELLISNPYNVICYNKGEGSFFLTGEFQSYDLDKYFLDSFSFSNNFIKNKIPEYLLCEPLTYDLLIKPYPHLIKNEMRGIRVGGHHSDPSHWTCLFLLNEKVYFFSFNDFSNIRIIDLIFNNQHKTFTLLPKTWKYDFIIDYKELTTPINIFLNKVHLKTYTEFNDETIFYLK